MRYLLRYWVPAVLFMAAIFVGSSISKPPDVPGGFSDKTAHFCEYAVLGLLLARALAGRRWLSPPFPIVAAAALLAALYGVSDEYHQLFVPGRQYDVRDMMADAFGASLSVGALWTWSIISRFCRLRSRASHASSGGPAVTAGDGAQRGRVASTNEHAVRTPSART